VGEGFYQLIMKIILIGSGNLATHLAVALKASGYEIAQIFSRTLENAESLAEKTDATYTDEIEQINGNADLYIFSVKDDVLPEILEKMPKTTGIWAHTAGSVSTNIFSPYTDNYGAIYPLQTFSKNRPLNFTDIPVFIEGSNSETAHFLETVAKSISKNVQILSSEKRQYLHLAAVFASNFTNHLYTLSAEILEKEGISFDVLKPLITETAKKAVEIPPKVAQTGPAVRFDETVMNKHLDLLRDENMKNIYKILSESIYKGVKGKGKGKG
jgi:predicted short-subunit dehydrogenase-like oxidoreductase (DUF2520 family)